MAMDIELRNTLGALTAQVKELTTQTKTLESALTSALDKGSKSAAGMAVGTRAARVEMSLVEQVSTRVGRTFASQTLALATGAIGVTALWQAAGDAINAAIAKGENSKKASRDFADKSRPTAPPLILPELRKAIRTGAPAIDPNDQAEALKTFLGAGGNADVTEVHRLGQVLNSQMLLGFDNKELATHYAKLRKLGVRNPEDVIMALAKQGKSGDLDKMKAGQAQAFATKNAGAWNKGVLEARRMNPADARAWEEKTKAALEANAELDRGNAEAENFARLTKLGGFTGASFRPAHFNRQDKREKVGPWGMMMSPSELYRIQTAFPGKSMQEVAAYIDKILASTGADTGLFDVLPQQVEPVTQPAEAPASAAPAAAVVPPRHWSQVVSRPQSPTATRAPVAEVRIVGDTRPVPVNAGD